MDNLLNNNGEWKVKQSYFQGWIKSEIEHLKEEAKDTKNQLIYIRTALDDLDKFDKILMLRLLGTGGLAGAFVSILINYIL